MKTFIIAAAFATVSSAAFAQQAPWHTGDYSASVQQSLDGNVDNGQFRLNFDGAGSARDMSAGKGWGNYSANITPSDVSGR